MDSQPAEKHPLNLNSADFDSEAFVSNLLQRKGLDELVAVEEDMVQNVRRLDSEMQQLVYENYNKFLTATNTVRNMQTAFTEMDNEMHGLSGRIKEISVLSESLSGTFNKNRETVRRLTEASRTVERLQHFVKLPQILQDLIDQKSYKKAVEIYTVAKPKLERYREVKSMAGIYTDSMAAIRGMEERFRECLKAKVVSSEELLEAIQLLRMLDADDDELRAELLTNWSLQLNDELSNLESQVSSNQVYADILEFVNNGGYNFLTTLSLHISVFVQLFTKASEKAELVQLVEGLMLKFQAILNKRFVSEVNPRDCALFVSALDKISRKIAVVPRLLQGLDFSRMNAGIVISAAEHQIDVCRKSISTSFTASLNEILQSLCQSSPENVELSATNPRKPNKKVLLEMMFKLEQSLLISVKTCLANLLLFTASDINFANIEPEYFTSTFGVTVHENIIAGSIQDLVAVTKDHNSNIFQTPISTLFLIFSGVLRSLQSKQLSYLMDLCQEQFKLTERRGKPLSGFEKLSGCLKTGIEVLLRKFVEVECKPLVEVAAANIEAFDWTECSEAPKSVRAPAKRLFQCIESVDKLLCVFMDDGPKKESTPDSLRSTGGGRRVASAASNTYETASLNSSIMERLWGEEVDNDQGSGSNGEGGENTGAHLCLEFKRDSVLTTVVRITLKRMAEAVQRQRFTLFGMQQLQVDCGFLKHQLWRLAVDEHVLNSLIEETVTFAVNQCPEPKLLEPTVVRDICERS